MCLKGNFNARTGRVLAIYTVTGEDLTAWQLHSSTLVPGDYAVVMWKGLPGPEIIPTDDLMSVLSS